MRRPARTASTAPTFTTGHLAAVIVAASLVVLGTASWMQGIAA